MGSARDCVVRAMLRGGLAKRVLGVLLMDGWCGRNLILPRKSWRVCNFLPRQLAMDLAGTQRSPSLHLWTDVLQESDPAFDRWWQDCCAAAGIVGRGLRAGHAHACTRIGSWYLDRLSAAPPSATDTPLFPRSLSRVWCGCSLPHHTASARLRSDDVDSGRETANCKSPLMLALEPSLALELVHRHVPPRAHDCEFPLMLSTPGVRI